MSGSLASLGLAGSAAASSDGALSLSSANSAAHANAPSAGGQAAVLQAILDRLERLEHGRSVQDRPPTPHPVAARSAAAPAAASRSRPPGSNVAQFLFGGQGHAPAAADDADESGDEKGDGDGNLVAAATAAPTGAPKPHPLFERLAPQVIEDVGSAGFKEWLRTELRPSDWRNNRNASECEVLAEALDALTMSRDPEQAVEIGKKVHLFAR